MFSLDWVKRFIAILQLGGARSRSSFTEGCNFTKYIVGLRCCYLHWSWHETYEKFYLSATQALHCWQTDKHTGFDVIFYAARKLGNFLSQILWQFIKVIPLNYCTNISFSVFIQICSPQVCKMKKTYRMIYVKMRMPSLRSISVLWVNIMSDIYCVFCLDNDVAIFVMILTCLVGTAYFLFCFYGLVGIKWIRVDANN